MLVKDCTLQNYFDWRDRPFVYFLRRPEDGLIKIGWSQNIIQRLEALRQEHGPLEILAITSGGPLAEEAWHDCYKDLREHGEWFKPEEDLMVWFDDEWHRNCLMEDSWPGESPPRGGLVVLEVEGLLPPLREWLPLDDIEEMDGVVLGDSEI